MSDDDRSRWDARWRERGSDPGQPSALVTSVAALLPERGRALDVAGGAGRHALWLARRGLDVTVADISEVALEIVRDAAARAGLPLGTAALDLERDPLPDGPWDMILCVHYLERRLLKAFPRALSPGGVLVVLHPTRSNLSRHEHPSARFLLEDGELPGLLEGGLEVLHYDEGWLAEGWHEALLVARRPS
jgi:SAM-dependent methyltransferase